MTELLEQPGAVNAHTHLYSGLAPLGMPAPVPAPATFPEILRRVWWRLDRALDEASLRAAARYHVAHALLAGTTTLFDHHESPAMIEGALDVLAGACEELGMRAVLCYGATERNGGREEAERGLAESARFARARQAGLVRGAVGLHASFTVSDATLRTAGELANELQVPVHVHVAEDASDVEDARARGHASPLARMLACDALPSGSILAHGVHLTGIEVSTCESRALWLVHNPRSNAANRVGYASRLSGSAFVALGTDGFASDMAEEVAALRVEAARHGDGVTDAESPLAAGRVMAAEVFGSAAIAADRVRREPPERPAKPNGSAKRAARGRVIEVDVGGRAAVRGGRLVGADLAEIDAEAAREARRLWSRMEEIP
jgi:cytosine/adenosine deaminase-related metal-dependent hydrolase